MAFRHCQRPRPSSRPAVTYAESKPRKFRGRPGWYLGRCHNQDIYSTKWTPAYRLRPQWQEAMEWSIVIDIAGGIAEAIPFGKRNHRDALQRALSTEGALVDFDSIDLVLTDLRALTGQRLERFVAYRHYAARAMKLLKANWPAVEAIAVALIRDRHIDAAEALMGTALPTPGQR